VVEQFPSFYGQDGQEVLMLKTTNQNRVLPVWSRTLSPMKAGLPQFASHAFDSENFSHYLDQNTLSGNCKDTYPEGDSERVRQGP
jgi:hypothetical protein